MILDEKLEFCSNLAVDSTTGTSNEGDVIDLDDAGRRLHAGLMKLVIIVTAAFTSGTSSTVAFKLVSDSTDTPATNGDETLHWQSETFAHTALTLGKRLVIPIPSGIPAYERYLGLQVVTGAATTTAGSISAFLVTDEADWAALADASN